MTELTDQDQNQPEINPSGYVQPEVNPSGQVQPGDKSQKNNLSLDAISQPEQINRDEGFEKRSQRSQQNGMKVLSNINDKNSMKSQINDRLVQDDNLNNDIEVINADNHILKNELDLEAGIHQEQKNDFDIIDFSKDKDPSKNQNSTLEDKSKNKQIPKVVQKKLPPTKYDREQRKSKCVAAFFILFTLGIAAFCTVAYTILKPTLPEEYFLVKKNWKYSPIINIRPNSNGCNEYFTQYTFPGTIEGCNCQSSLIVLYQNLIFPSSCTSEQLQNGCFSVESTLPQQFTHWRSNLQDFQLCVDRIPGFTFTDSNCGDVSFRICGVKTGTSDGNFKFCIPSIYQCPLNSIVFGNEPPDTTYSSILNTGNGNFYISRDQVTSMPLALSLVSTGSGACKDYENYHFIDELIHPYILLSNRNKTCNLNQTEPRFNQLVQIYEIDYLKSNSYYDQVKSSLLGYNLDQNQKYSLMTRSYVPWYQGKECRYVHMNTFLQLEEKFETIINLWKASIAANWAIFLVYGVIASCLRVNLYWKITNGYIFLAWILLIIQLAFTILCFLFSFILKNLLSAMKSAKCSDSSTNKMISDFDDKFSSTVMLYWIILLALTGSLILFSLIFMKFIFAIKRKNEENAKEEEEQLLEQVPNMIEEDKKSQKLDVRSISLKEKTPLNNNDNGGYTNTFNIFNNTTPAAEPIKEPVIEPIKQPMVEEKVEEIPPEPEQVVESIVVAPVLKKIAFTPSVRKARIIQRPVIEEKIEHNEEHKPKLVELVVIEKKKEEPEVKDKKFIEDARKRFLEGLKKKKVDDVSKAEGNIQKSQEDSGQGVQQNQRNFEFDDINQYVQRKKDTDQNNLNKVEGENSEEKGKQKYTSYKYPKH